MLHFNNRLYFHPFFFCVYDQVESWTQAEMASAPLGMRNGWFVSHLSLYDVQRSLARETVAAIIISTISSLVVVCLTTRDLILSIGNWFLFKETKNYEKCNIF